MLSSSSISNPYSDLNELNYSGSASSRKAPLKKQQVKSRNAAKRARKARRNNR